MPKRYEVSAGKARLAKDMVDIDAVQEKENERKALEQAALAEFLASQGVQTPTAESHRPVGQRNRTEGMTEQPRFTALGKILSILLVGGLVALGVYMLRGRGVGLRPIVARKTRPTGGRRAGSLRGQGRSPEVVSAGAAHPQDNTLPIEISEYAGYAGLIAANGGLEPTENSSSSRTTGSRSS